MKLSIRRLIPGILLVSVGALLMLWLEFTPAGLLGKLDAIGYSVCHQIPERSFWLADRPLPLCARCSGMYLGAWVGFLYHLTLKKSGSLPTRPILMVLATFALVFIIDGLNSYLTLFHIPAVLYEPQNWLRLLTGSSFGLGVAAILVPSFNRTVWIDATLQPAFTSWKSLVLTVGAAMLVNLAMLSGNPLLVYPLSVLSSLTVLVVLFLAYSMLWVLATRKENTFTNWKQARWHLLAGFGTALLQIALMDALRYAVTGSWAGF